LPWGTPGNPTVSGDPLIFVFLPGHEADLSAVQASYPGGVLLEQRNAEGTVLYTVYEVSPSGR
jgi:hypothetical protein